MFVPFNHAEPRQHPCQLEMGIPLDDRHTVASRQGMSQTICRVVSGKRGPDDNDIAGMRNGPVGETVQKR